MKKRLVGVALSLLMAATVVFPAFADEIIVEDETAVNEEVIESDSVVSEEDLIDEKIADNETAIIDEDILEEEIASKEEIIDEEMASDEEIVATIVDDNEEVIAADVDEAGAVIEDEMEAEAIDEDTETEENDENAEALEENGALDYEADDYEISEDGITYSGLTVLKDMKLTENVTVEGDLILSAGELNVNGYSLVVNGNVIGNGGKIDLTANLSKLTVSGDMTLKSGTFWIGENSQATIKGNLTYQAVDSDGYIAKSTANFYNKGTCNVGKDFLWNSTGSFNNRPDWGRIKLGGNYIDKIGVYNRNKIELVGGKEQKLALEAGSYIDQLFPSSYKVIVNEYFNVKYLKGNVSLKTSETTIKTKFREKMYFEGYSLTVPCNYDCTDGDLDLSKDNSKLTVSGDMTLGTGSFSIGANSQTTIKGSLIFQAVDSDGYIAKSTASFHNSGICNVGKDFLWNSTGVLNNSPNWGRIKLGGNYTDKIGVYNRNKIELVGGIEQKLTLKSGSYIDQLFPSSYKVVVGEYFNVKYLKGNVNLKTSKTTIKTNNRMYFEGYSLTVPCNYDCTGGELDMGTTNSKLKVSGKMTLGGGNLWVGASSQVTTTGSLIYQGVDSTGATVKSTANLYNRGTINVGNDFLWNSSGRLNDQPNWGTIVIAGNYTDKIGKYNRNVVKMTTKGKKITTSGEKINVLELNGRKNEYTIITPNCWNTLRETFQEGWKKDSTGYWYQNSDGTFPQNDWKKINGVWYHFNSKGYMETGWILVGKNYYYLNSNGAMQTGWVQVGSKWYHMASDGVMQTGWQKVDGVWYYFKSSGVMQTGWQKIDGAWYYFKSSGAMQTGWIKLGDNWYYLYSTGKLATNTWIGNSWVDGDGVWTRSR